MPTGLLNVVCDDCYGGKLVFLPTGERQLQHQLGCMWKYREDTFLVELCLGLGNCHHLIYPKEAKLNPIIYDMLSEGWLTHRGNETFAKRGQSMAQKRAQRLNQNFQLIKEALISEGRWDNIRKEVMRIGTQSRI